MVFRELSRLKDTRIEGGVASNMVSFGGRGHHVRP